MALTPQNSDAFLREVDEELRRDQAGRLWRRWGRVVLGLLAAGLLAFGGYLWWQHRQTQVAGEEGEALSVALADLSEGKTDAAKAKFTPLLTSKVEGHRVAATLALADIKLAAGDAKGAGADYGKIAADESLAKPYRDLALVRQVSALYDTLPPAEVVTRLKPLAVAGNPWFGSAGEMTAIALIRMNQPGRAGQMLAGIAKDKTVPESLRSRSVQLAGVLGVDTGPLDRN